MSSRRLGLVAVLPAALVLAACSSSTSGVGHAGATTAGGGSSSGGGFPSSATSGGGTGSLSALVSRMQSAVNGVTSAHLTLDVQAAGQTVSGSGDEQLAAGKLVAMDLTMQLPQIGEMETIVAGGKAYVKLPTSLNSSGKPYMLVSKDSSNAAVRSMARSLDSTLSQASLSSYSEMMSAAKSFKVVGPTSVEGVSATHYSIVLDTGKLPATMPGRDAITGSGITELPLELYLDDQGRTVEVTESLSVSGQLVDTKVTVTDYNKPVSISAPPADQVATG